jgi:hypothetical protein
MKRLLVVLVLPFAPAALQADSVSYTGTLANLTDVVEKTFTLISPGNDRASDLGFRRENRRSMSRPPGFLLTDTG